MNRIPTDYQPAPDLLRDRVILVTGAGQGLGRAVAIACAAHGATVALLGRKQDKLEATYDTITDAGNAQPALVPLDLATAAEAEFDALANLLKRDLKGLAGIAHCASHFLPLRPMADHTWEQWNLLLRVNLTAPFAMTMACLPLLAKKPGSAVVFTGETHGVEPAAFWGGFGVSKAALVALAAIWGDELEGAGKPRLNVLVPGPINSPQRAQSHPGENRAQLPSVEAAARGFLWLLGPDSTATSGETLRL
jgi:NAD(P)-dependent dehydrogenase (short-subunit alcohol dehydrogenase family)